MTDSITIQPGVLIDHGWMFTTIFEGSKHAISVSQAYWRKMTRGDISPMDLVRLGMELAARQGISHNLPHTFSLESLINRIPNFDRRLRAQAETEGSSNPR